MAKIDWDSLTFANNYIFLEVMNNKKRCQYLIEKILHIPITKILQIVAERRTGSPRISSKSIRLDVYVEDDRETVYDVEMQTTDDRNLPKRSRYYQGAIDTDMLSPSQEYNSLRKSIILFICCFDPFHRNLPRYRFAYRAEEDPSLLLGDETEKIFVNAEYVGELADGEFRSFLHFVSTEESTSSFTNEIAAAMDELNRSEEGRSLMTLEMKLREERRIAKEAGIEMGREEVVLSMLDAGDVSMELACKWLNLSEEEVAKRLEAVRSRAV